MMSKDGVDKRRNLPSLCAASQGWLNEWVTGASDSQKYQWEANGLRENIAAP